MPNINVTDSNIHIEDSYKIRKRTDMEKILFSISTPTDVLKKRTIKSLIREWRTHNLFYDLYLFRSHTKDVDLNYPQKKYISILYFIGSVFYIGI